MAAGAMAATAAAGAGARILGALIGRAIAEGDYQRAEQLQREALEQYGSMDPDVLQGIDVEAGTTELDKYREDPEAQQAQLVALRRLGQTATESNPEDAAAFAQASAESGNMERGLRESALRRLQERGLSPASGIGVAMQMNAAQQSVSNKNAADLDVAAESRRRALSALGQYGRMAGDIRGQNFQQANARASAQDAINRFNAGQRFDQAQGTFNNRMGVADARSNGMNGLANTYRRKGDMTQQTAAGVGDAIGDGFDAFGNPLPKKDQR